MTENIIQTITIWYERRKKNNKYIIIEGQLLYSS